MYADHVAATEAAVLFRLSFKEFVHAFASEFFLVLLHTHAIALPVTLIQPSQVCTRHVAALIAVLDLVLG